MINRFLSTLVKYKKDERGAIAIVFAVAIPVLILATMVAVDLLLVYEGSRQAKYIAEHGCQRAANLARTLGDTPAVRDQRIEEGFKFMKTMIRAKGKAKGIKATNDHEISPDWIEYTDYSVEFKNRNSREGRDTFIARVTGKVDAMGMSIFGYKAHTFSEKDECRNDIEGEKHRPGEIVFIDDFYNYLQTTVPVKCDKDNKPCRGLGYNIADFSLWRRWDQSLGLEIQRFKESFRRDAKVRQCNNLQTNGKKEDCEEPVSTALNLDVNGNAAPSGNNSALGRHYLYRGTYQVEIFYSSEVVGDKTFWDNILTEADTEMCTQTGVENIQGAALNTYAISICMSNAPHEALPIHLLTVDRTPSGEITNMHRLKKRFSVEEDGYYFIKMLAHGASDGEGGLIDRIKITRVDEKIRKGVTLLLNR